MKVSTRLFLVSAAVAAALGLAFVLGLPSHSFWSGEPPGSRKANRLIHEKSPYLLQHASNPVDWYPWGQEAFDAAAEAGKPIFLSIGYSTCHWCHVMERESFSNPEIAALMNRHFISIKVDREERPDVDQVYMTFVQATTGGGGWPLSVFLTPDLKPFFGGTYFSPESRHGRPGFKQVLNAVAERWKANPERIVESAGKLAAALEEMADQSSSGDLEIDKQLLDQAYRWYESEYDEKYGGFGKAPKFPRPVNFNFLLRHYKRTGEKKALEMTLGTLRGMALGGMHDHLGGGFHRYSTDARWFLPHFEKMLYDQALLAVSFLEAFQISRDPFFAETARGILDYVLRQMTHPGGGFYSAEDADSPLSRDNLEEKGEGAFYVWTAEEIDELFRGDAALVRGRFGVKAGGNVKYDPFGEFKDKNVLFAETGVDELSKTFNLPVQRIEDRLRESRAKLFRVRALRPRPLRDDKILTAWNGLMISAFAKGAQVLGHEPYLDVARKAATFVLDELYQPAQKRLKRRWRLGEASIDGFSDDYFFLTQGLLDLYETTLEERWLSPALDLTEAAAELFWDQAGGGFYNTAGSDPSILIRVKEAYDGAEPSPNSIAALNLLRLSQISGDPKQRDRAERLIQAFELRLSQAPQAMPQLLAAVDFYLEKPRQILIAGQAGCEDTQALLREVHRRYLPNKVIFLADGGKLHRRFSARLEILESLKPRSGKATAYICEDYVCQLPTSDPAQVGKLLDAAPRRSPKKEAASP